VTATDTGAYASPLLALAGAVAADPPDTGVAAHYGDPMREQRRVALDREGFVDLSHRGIVRVAGPDRLSWLHALTTQDVEHLAPGESATALLLSPQGHVEHALAMVDDGDAVWMHVEPGTAPQLVAFLESMRFLMRVEVSDLSAEYAIRWEPATQAAAQGAAAKGDSAEGATAEAADGAPTGGTPAGASPAGASRAGASPAGRTAAEDASGHLVRQGADSLGGREIFLPRAKLTEMAQGAVGNGTTAAGAGPGAGSAAGLWGYEALRIAAHVPRMGFETDHRTIPNEVGWLGTGVHLDKGCYRGQETVARVHNLGRPPRRLVLLHLDGSGHELPEPGADVVHGERRVGFVTTPARHHEDGPIALAIVKRSTPADVQLLAVGEQGRGVDAAQEVIVAP
jgi:tRNA-modifying protein YgfZ